MRGGLRRKIAYAGLSTLLLGLGAVAGSGITAGKGMTAAATRPGESVAATVRGRARGRAVPRAISLPHAYGAIVAFSDMSPGVFDTPVLHIEPNHVSGERMVAEGFNGIKLMPRATVLSDDMRGVITNPGLDLIVIRPLDHPELEDTCNGPNKVVWGDLDYGSIAEQLLENYGDLDKTIVLTNCETVWQIMGDGCQLPDQCQPNDYDNCVDYVFNHRLPLVKERLEARQRGVMEARARHPDAKLRVYNAVEVTARNMPGHPASYDWDTPTDLLPYLNPRPDIISLSYWERNVPIETALEIIKSVGYPANRIYIGEIGRKEKNPGDQYDYIYDTLTRACENEGVCTAFGWIWLQGWGDQSKENMGFWVMDADGNYTIPNSGVQAMRDLTELFGH